MADVIRWGIIGSGNIASQFARGLQSVPDAELLAIGSRAQASADEFGDEFNIPRRYPTYEQLAHDPDVDAIYISTPHPFHYANAMLCIEAGKAVLCEKPFALNAREATEMIAAARAKGTFLMEAMWTRFIPAFREVKARIDDGEIGDLQRIRAAFGFRTEYDPQHRLFSPKLGGGALLDVGIYPISLASYYFGQPSRIDSAVRFAPTGVDEYAALICTYDSGYIAELATATRTEMINDAEIGGTEGVIRILPPWFVPQNGYIVHKGDSEQHYQPEFVGNGYNYEAQEVARCLREGLLESPVITLDETLAIMQTLDNIREGWGLKYPSEG